MCGLEFRDIVKSRYSARSFDGRKIPEEKMEELYEIIRNTPSALNLQPWKIKVITDQETKNRLLPATMDQPQVASCSHLLVFCASEQMKEHIEMVAAEMRKAGMTEERVDRYIRFARDYVVHVSPEQLKVWTQHNVFLALATAMYGAESLGIDSSPMGRFDVAKYKRILKLPPYLIPTVLCALGYATDTPGAKIRLPKEDIFF